MKKTMTFLLCLSLVLSFCPIALTANEEAGEANSATEYDESGSFDMDFIDEVRPPLDDPVAEETDLYGNADFEAETAAQLRGERVPNEILVKFKEPWQVPGKEKQLQHEIDKLKKIGFVEGLGVYIVRVDDLEKNPNAVLNRLKNNKYIDYIEPNYTATSEIEPNDPGYPRNQAAQLVTIKAQAGWNIISGSKSAPVAVIDTGVISTHQDLPALASGYSAVSGLQATNDRAGHGTSVAGVIGAKANNGIGGVGINWDARIIPVKVDDASGGLSVANLAKGITWAADNGARVISLSVSTTSDSATLKSAIDYAYNKGCAIFASSGNGSASSVNFPARYTNVMGVGSVNDTGTARVATSNYGTGLDITALGLFYSTIIAGGSQVVSGTSFATPQVAALATLILGLDEKKTLTNADVYDLIKRGASGNGTRINNEIGFGVINIERTLQLTQEKLGTSKKDTTPPVLTLLGGSTIQVKEGESFVEPGYRAIDDVDGDITSKVTVTGAINTNVPGTYTLTYRVSDAAGNTSTATRTLQVIQVDRTPPVITLLGSQTMQIKQGESYVEPGYTAFDAVDGNVTSKVTVTGTVNTNAPGTYTLTYRATDAAGNTGTATRSVEVIYVDRTPPVITLNGSRTIQIMQGEDYIEMWCTAIDNIDGDISDRVIITEQIDVNTPGSYTVTYRVSDAAGNEATATRTVEVLAAYEPDLEDVFEEPEIPTGPPVATPAPTAAPTPTPAPQPLPPTITLTGFGEMTLIEGNSFYEDGFSASDYLGNDITGRVQTRVLDSLNRSYSVDDFNKTYKWTPGLYRFTYSVTDSFGGTAAATRIVFVEPAPPPPPTPPPPPPTITANGSAVIVLHQNVHQYVEQSARAIDYDGAPLQVAAPTWSPRAPDYKVAGTYTATYRVTGKSGASVTTTRTVRVVAPVTASAERKAYSFSGQAKAGTKVTHTNVVADAAGFFDLRVSSIDKNMTITVELVNTATKVVAAKDTFSAAGMKQYSIAAAKYDLVVTVTQANGNSKYTVNLTMPEVRTQSFGEVAVPLDELPDLPDAQDGGTATPGTVTYTVATGDSLWKIAQKHFGTGLRWYEIYDMNREAIGKNPSALQVGQVLAIKTE